MSLGTPENSVYKSYLLLLLLIIHELQPPGWSSCIFCVLECHVHFNNFPSRVRGHPRTKFILLTAFLAAPSPTGQEAAIPICLQFPACVCVCGGGGGGAGNMQNGLYKESRGKLFCSCL